jgi:hypothetical protein
MNPHETKRCRPRADPFFLDSSALLQGLLFIIIALSVPAPEACIQESRRRVEQTLPGRVREGRQDEDCPAQTIRSTLTGVAR